MNHLYLIRGVPGSGKSTKAKRMLQPGWRHFEADQYFMRTGKYRYDQSKSGEAHRWCQGQTFHALRRGETVIVSNTFVTVGRLQVYIDMANQLGVPYTVYTCQGDFGSIHDVPEDVMMAMRDAWEPFEGEIMV